LGVSGVGRFTLHECPTGMDSGPWVKINVSIRRALPRRMDRLDKQLRNKTSNRGEPERGCRETDGRPGTTREPARFWERPSRKGGGQVRTNGPLSEERPGVGAASASLRCAHFHDAGHGGCGSKRTLQGRTAVSRWLLMTDDRIEGDEIALTHGVLTAMIGVQRPGRDGWAPGTRAERLHRPHC
jgi:hypothetical protein